MFIFHTHVHSAWQYILFILCHYQEANRFETEHWNLCDIELNLVHSLIQIVTVVREFIGIE